MMDHSSANSSHIRWLKALSTSGRLSVIRAIPSIGGDIKNPDAKEGALKRTPVAAVATLPKMWKTTAAELATDPAWCFPLVARDRSRGAFVIGRPRDGVLAREAVELAEDLTRRVALALDNARLYEQQQLTSQALQRSLLPPELPQIPGIDLSVAHQVAGEGNEVGGDFYDVYPAGPNRWRFAIGDVCGTGP